MHRPGLAGPRDQQQLAVVHGLLPHLCDQRARVLRRGQEIRPALAGEVLAGGADHGQERAVGEEHAVVGVDDDDAFADPSHHVGQLARLAFQPRVLDRDGDSIGDDVEKPVGPIVDPP